MRDNAILPPTASGDTLVCALLALTASGDDTGARFCVPLPPSPHFSLTTFTYLLTKTTLDLLRSQHALVLYMLLHFTF